MWCVARRSDDKAVVKETDTLKKVEGLLGVADLKESVETRSVTARVERGALFRAGERAEPALMPWRALGSWLLSTLHCSGRATRLPFKDALEAVGTGL